MINSLWKSGEIMDQNNIGYLPVASECTDVQNIHEQQLCWSENNT